jgi:Arc/MetJ family transcription regulator
LFIVDRRGGLYEASHAGGAGSSPVAPAAAAAVERPADDRARRHRCASAAGRKVYCSDVSKPTIRRTNINLDKDLIEAAAVVLGTARTTDTVHAALRAVVDRAARERLAGHDFADLTPSELERMRAPRKSA